MPIRFYVAPQQGTGTFVDPFRSILNDLINVQAGESFTEIDHSSRRISICCVRASDTTHATILADARVFPASPLYADDVAMAAGMEVTLNNIPNIAAIKTKLENAGVSTAWISGSNTLRDALRYLVRNFSTCQIADGEANANVKTFLTQSLDLTVQQLTVVQRNAVKDWMQAKGLAIGWIVNTTTVREIIHFIIGNLGFGKFRISGVEF